MLCNTENIKDYLVEKNIKPSFARIKILEYLIVEKNHPTVDKIYSELAKEMPTLSKSTVYNTLNSFIKEDVARVVTIEEGETRYDVDITNHGHFKCRDCGEIYDFKINEMGIDKDGLEDFKVDEKNVYYLGSCKNCLKNKNI